MKIKEIDEKTFDKYASNHKYASIYELSGWGKLKESTNWNYYLIGLYDNEEKIKGATLLLSKRTLKNKYLFYSPRGYLVDANDKKLLTEFHKLIIKFIKEHNGFMLKVDPNIIYKTYDKDGVELSFEGKNAFDNYLSLGFKHFGFNKNFETLQPRYLCRFKLANTYEDTLNSFSKSTRKNVEKSINMGVKVKKLDVKDTKIFTDVLNKTAQEKDFVIRPTSYYEKMYELLNDYMALYVTYIDTEEYYNNLLREQKEIEKSIDELNELKTKINVGDKIKKQEEDLNNKKEKNVKDIEYAKTLKEKGSEINIGALMSLFVGSEAVTFMSGTLSEYKEFYPKYAYYNKHIIDALEMKKEYVNFYGISGDLNKSNKYYGIYEIKKGYNPEIIELLGEFDYVIKPFTYRLYKLGLKMYKLKKKILK